MSGADKRFNKKIRKFARSMFQDSYFQLSSAGLIDRIKFGFGIIFRVKLRPKSFQENEGKKTK